VLGRTLLLLTAAILAGCNPPTTPAPRAEPSAPPVQPFNEALTGTITGQVCWSGELPQAAPYFAPFSPLGGQAGDVKCLWANPNLPFVDAKTHGVRDAVVFLRGAEVTKARPWNGDPGPVRVEFRDNDMFVVQDDYVGRRGIVQRGQSFEVISKQTAFEALQVRGDAFFTLTLPDPDQPRSRRLDRAGVVELSSGVARFWMRGHLFVADHPYYARTDAEGRFTLPKVPEGTYQLVCWHPNWHEDVREHDADTCCICRLTFRPAAEVERKIEVRRHETREVTFSLSLTDFPR
jgi:Polysaccharide lyase family 4, domain II